MPRSLTYICICRVVLVAALLGVTFPAFAAGTQATESYGGRELIIYVPAKLPAPGTRALVVVLHGGLGNAGRVASERSEGGLNMDKVAEEGGFIVAYLNGTKVARLLGSDKEGWNAGNCCGQPA